MSPTIVTLLTDFGQEDAFVGVMKGVILARAAGARIVDLTHNVAPQAVAEGAFLLETAVSYFPAGSVHVVVVDPGVGTARLRLALRAGGSFFVGPDNGVLSPALPEAVRGRRRPGEPYRARAVALPDEVEAVAIENEELFLKPVSATFEGRDVFAPAAAFLAAGGGLGGLGRRIREALALPAFRAAAAPRGLRGLVLHADRFGNLVTDIRAADLPAGAVLAVAGRRLSLAPNYAAAAGLCAIVGSAGYVEVALPGGSAAADLSLGPGAAVEALF